MHSLSNPLTLCNGNKKKRANKLCIRAVTGFFIVVSKTRSFIKYWLLPLAWMSLIFVGSSDSQSAVHSSRFVGPLLQWLFPHMSEAHKDLIHHLIRKCGHLSEYAVLAIVLWRAVRKPIRRDPRPWNWREARIAVGIVFLYAATDEFHQIFVPTRTALVSDVFIDTSGAIAGMIFLWLLEKIFRWWPKREN